MENINKEGNFNSRIIALNNAYRQADTKTVRLIIDSLKAKRDYYDTVTVESLRDQVESYEDKLYGPNAVQGEERQAINEEIVALREQIVEKRDFVKNKELIDEICSENLSNLLPEETKRIKRNRVIKGAVAAATVVAIIALGVKGCSNSKKNGNESTSATTVVNVITENGDETISAGETSFEETSPIEAFETNGYSIDPAIGTGNYGPTTGGSNNGGIGSTTGGTTNGTTNGTANGTTTPSNVITIPGPNGTDTTVVITYNDDGEPNPITWPTTETTINAPIVDTTPHGTDPLPVEPSVIVDPVPTGDIPTETTIVVPAPTNTPAVPTGDIPGVPETVYPTEPSVPVPTDATRPSEPTWPTPAPTSPQPTPEIPTWDLPDEEVTEYDMSGNVISGSALGIRLR